MSVKALAERILQGNRPGNQKETKSFLIPEIRKPETPPRETLPFGITLEGLQAEYGHDPDWPRIKDDPLWLHFLAEDIRRREHRTSGEEKGGTAAGTRTADQFTPAERSRWCLAHELTRPGHRCPNKKKLEGCTLWQAVRGSRLLHPPRTAGYQEMGGHHGP